MAWRNLFKKHHDSQSTAASPDVEAASSHIPPGRDEAIGRRSPQRPATVNDHDQRRLAGLRRQRMAIVYDIEQGELATAADNPWTNRISLLGEALGTVTADLAAAGRVEPGPWHQVPETPIAIDRVEAGDVATVALTVGHEPFVFAEEPDWAERGHQVTRGELSLRAGDVRRLVPADTPGDLREPLAEHLGDSLFVLAADLRDRALDGAPMPASPTLADLARPCPICGGWTDWRGTCQACARRQARVSALKREERRLLDERQREVEERHRLIEGLPIARRRLQDVENELARLGDTV